MPLSPVSDPQVSGLQEDQLAGMRRTIPFDVVASLVGQQLVARLPVPARLGRHVIIGSAHELRALFPDGRVRVIWRDPAQS